MRRLKLEVGGRRWKTTLDDAISLSIRLDFDGEQPNAFGLPDAQATPIEYDGQVSDTRQGGPFNCSVLSIIPHGNGTHTEGAGHLVDGGVAIGDLVDEALIPCTVVSVDPKRLGDVDDTYTRAAEPDDEVITRSVLAQRAADLGLPPGFLRSLAIRTKPNDESKRQRRYGETNPPYLSAEAVDWILEQGIEHLLVDLPSVDRERDDGELRNHHAYWDLSETERGPEGRSRRTITEMIYVPNGVPDGVYFLGIDVPDFNTDAAPSRPMLYEAMPVE